ncbi:hypothetical protein BKA93DRAFT_738594 [Sparassis latifolia]
MTAVFSYDIGNSLPHSGFKFNTSAAPPYSKFKTPSWVRHGPVTPGEANEVNGLGEPWDWRRPSFRGIDLTKPDRRVKPNLCEIFCSDPDARIVFKDVNIIDSTGKAPYQGAVLIKGNRIVSVGGSVSEADCRGARVFEGRGRTLMSGLVDAHTHLTWNNAGTLEALAAMGVEEHTIFTARSARTYLDCGYTMTVGAAAAKQRLDIAIRDIVNKGDLPGPRILANGQEISPLEGALIPCITAIANTPEEIREVVAGHARDGCDLIKLNMSGDEITETLRSEDTTFTDDLVAAAVEAAHSHGMRVCSHARSDESILQCLQYGVDIIYHASFISDVTMDALEAQKSRVFVAPALNFPYATLYDGEEYGYDLSRAESIGYVRELEVAIEACKEMRKRGIRILPGGDYGFAWSPHGTYRDLEHFVKLLGFTPEEAIMSATALGGEIMMRNDLGKVQPGYLADVILVNGNPLEDITLLSHQENIDVVVVNGRIHKSSRKDQEPWFEPTPSLLSDVERSKGDHVNGKLAKDLAGMTL